MSLSSTTTRNTYTGNGSTSVFAYTFKIFANSDLVVTKRLISTGVETTLVLTTDYTVSGVGSSSGGNVTLVAGALASTYKLVIRRVRPLTQLTDIRNQSAFYASSHEDTFDNLTMIDQGQQDAIDRSVKLPSTFTASDFDPTLPASAVGAVETLLATNTGGNGFEMGPTVASINTAIANAAAAVAATTATMSANAIRGNNTVSAVAPLDLTPAQVAAMLPVVVGDSGSGGVKGLCPSPGAGDAAAGKFLKADGTYAVPPSAAGVTSFTGDVTGTGPGATAATIAANAVTNAKLAQMAATTIKGNNTVGTTNALDLTPAQVNAMLPVFTSLLNGLVPLSGGGTTNFLRADGAWATTSPLTTKGDLYGFSTVGARIGVGADGTVLTADSTQGLGVKWAVASGGGGGSIQWVEDQDSPVPSTEQFMRIYSFGSGLAQKLYCLIKVPNSYVAGSPIKVLTSFYSPDSSGTALINAVATLVRSGTDAITSTTNQRTTTNSAVTLGAGTVNKPQNVTLDVSSTIGQINAVAISANDLILVQLTRGSDTGTSDLKVPVYGAEVTFN